MKRKLIELMVAIDNSTMIAGDSSTFLSIMDRTTRQIINTETKEGNNTRTRHRRRLRTLPSVREEQTFFRRAHEMFSRMDHNRRHKMGLDKFKTIEIAQSISNHKKWNWKSVTEEIVEIYTCVEIKQHISPMGQEDMTREI